MHKLSNIFSIAGAVLCAFLASCGMNQAELEREVASQFQRDLDTDADLKAYGMNVSDVTLVKSGGHAYNGYVTVTLDGAEHDIGVTVTVNGDSFMYETKPLAFGFLVGRMLYTIFSF
ncbi:MAG: hypothetical protein LBK61_11410 [Spirochaetaceae bacterium]|jgi:hypothetical protein|nr:hypothetical protein [Spirochaetaceae bacterium]